MSPDPLERSFRCSATSRSKENLEPSERSYPLEVSGISVKQISDSCSHCPNYLANFLRQFPCPRSDSN